MRCKVSLGAKVNLGDGGFALSFYTAYAGSEDNDKYFKLTPSGYMHLQIVNEIAANNFEVGKYYYLDFSPA